MAGSGAQSPYPGGYDGFVDGAYDPSIADAVNRLEANSAVFPPQAISNVVATTVDDCLVTTTLTTTTQLDQLTLIALVKGQVITNVNLNSGAPSAAQTHLWAAITDITGGNVLAVSTDAGTTVTGGTTVQVFPLATKWTVPTTGQYYIHVVCNATTTLATFDAFAAVSGTRAKQAPIIAGSGSTVQTVAPTVGATLIVAATSLTATKGLAIWLN